MKNLFCLSFLLLSINAMSQDSILIQQVFEQIELQEINCNMNLATTSTYPEDETKSIVLIPEIAKQEDDYLEMNTHLFVVDSQTGKISQRYFESSETNDWYSDAVKITKINIDPTAYHLSHQTIAFGVLVHYEGNSQPNPFEKNTLSLFIVGDHSIQQVLKNCVVYQFNGEWDLVCNGEFKEQKKSLSMMLDKTTNGFLNLIIENNITHTIGTPDKNNECVFKDKITQEKLILKYKNGLYRA